MPGKPPPFTKREGSARMSGATAKESKSSYEEKRKDKKRSSKRK